MKILHVTVTLAAMGGAEASLLRLIENDPDDEHIVVSLRDFDRNNHVLSGAKAKFYSLEFSGGKLSLSGLRKLRQIVTNEQPDAIQSWMYHADLTVSLATLGANKPRLCWGVHHFNLDPSVNKRSTLLVARACALLSKRVPDAIIYCARAGAEVHEKYGYEPSKSIVVPNGYDLTVFNYSSKSRIRWRSEWGVDNSAFVIGCVGRWHPQKDHGNLIKSIAMLKNEWGSTCKCVLVGENMDSDNAELCSLIKRNKLEGSFILAGSQSDIAGIMSALDIHVLASKGEAFPNVVAEAMACKTPCIVTEVGDSRLIVGETGWIVPPENPVALATAIRSAMLELQSGGEGCDINDFETRRSAARQRILDSFSIEKIVSCYRSVWRNSAV